MAAAGDDAPAGLFSGVWSRLHAAASLWRRRGQAPGNDGDGREEREEEEAAVRSRLARRAAAARRLGRKLAFVSFNLEVLVFVYAFWRARRRSLGWRLPTQLALPILVVPALATLIYAAFVRFTRTLDLKDKKRLERLQEDKRQTDGVPRELDQDNHSDVQQNCDGVDDASSSSVADDSVPHTPRLRKRRQSSINKRDDGGADMAWGHSKGFQPMPSDGLRRRTFSSGKTYLTNSSSATERSEENTQSVSAYSDQYVHVPVSTEDSVSHPSDDHSGSAISGMLAQPANITQELSEEEFDGLWDITNTCSSSSKENLVCPAGPHNSFCDRDDSRSSEYALSSLSTAFQELLVKVNEEHSQSLPEKLESSPVFVKEVAASPPGGLVSHLSDPTPLASETLEELPSEGVKEKALLEPHTSAEENPTSCGLQINSDVETCLLPPIYSDAQDNAAVVNTDPVNPKWNLLLKLYGNEVEETKLSKFHVPEESTRPKSCLGTPEFSFCSQETKKLEPILDSPEEEAILDSPDADAAEQLLVTPLYTDEVEITEVHDVVQEDIFEPEGEEAFKYQNLAVTPSSDDSNTRNWTSDSIPMQFIPNTDLEALEGGQEASSELLHESTYAEEIFLSSRENSNDEVYSSGSNSYAKLLEGLSKFQEEMPINFSDTPIYLDEFNSAAVVHSDAASPKLIPQTDVHGGGVEENESSEYLVPDEIGTPFTLEEEVLLSPLAVNDGSLFNQLKFICQSAGTPELSSCNQESEEMEVAGSDNFIEASPELSFVSPPELVAEGGEDAKEKEAGGLNTEEENVTLISLEDEALQGELLVSTADHSLETSEFSLSSQGAKMTEVPGTVSSITVSSELSYPAFPELLAEVGEDLKEDKTSDLHLHEQKDLLNNLEEPFLDPLAIDTAEDALVTSEFLICSEEVKMTEVHGVVKEVLSESEDEGAFDHRKLVLSSPDDDSTAQNLVSNSIYAQFIPVASVKEASQAGHEALLEPPHESTCQSEGAFSSSGEINEVKAEVPFAGQEGLSNSDDEIASSPLDTPILKDEVRNAETLTDNSASPLSIPDSSGIQSLHDHGKASQEVTFFLEGSHTSSDEGINSEIFSLYSRSSSCVSEITMLETLRGGTSSEPPNDSDLSFDERNPVTFSSTHSTESNTNDPVTAEFVLETNMIGTLNAAEEANAGSPHEVSSNFLGTFVAPDVINDLTESDKHLDLSSSSFAPVIDAFESLETGQDFSEPYMSHEDVSDVQNSLADDYSSDLPQMVESHRDSRKLSPESQEPLSSEEILVYPDEVSNAEPWVDPQDHEDEDLTLHRAYVSPEDTSDVGNSLADDYSSDLPHMVKSHCVSEKLSPESQDPLSSQDLFYPDEGSTAENDLGTAYSPLCSTEVNLAEPWSIDQEETQQHDETMLGSEDIYMVDQEAKSENLGNNSGSLDIPDVTMTDSLRGAEIVSSEIPYDGMFSFEGTLISLDGNDNAEEDSPNNSDSVMHTARSNLGLQEGSFNSEDEKAINSISPYEVGTKETTYSSDFKPKQDDESKDMKEDVEDLEDDHENNPIGTFGVDESTGAPAPRPSIELYANDVSWRDFATGTINDFDMAVRKPVATISNSNVSSTVSELADVQYTLLDDDDDDDAETLGAPLLLSVATE